MQSNGRRRAHTWSIVGIALLLLGIVIRAALYFPLAMFQIDSDALLSGLCGLQVAQGQHPLFFPGGTRLGAVSCYAAAGYFHLFGPNRIAVDMTGLTWGALYLIFSLLFLRAVLGPKTACLAYIFAVFPSEQFMTVTYAPWGYGEIMASCAATLWLATLWRNQGALWQRICFGLSVGLGFWFSMETLMIALPAIAWIAVKRGSATIREALPALGGVIVGALPFLLGNVAHGYPSFTQNWALCPASTTAQVWDNLVWLLTYMLPKLLFRSSDWWSETTLLMVAYAIVAVGFLVALRRSIANKTEPSTTRDAAVLLLFVFIASVALFSMSYAGSSRGWTVRYIAPLYLVVPLFLGIGIQALWSWSKAFSIATVAALVLPNLVLYGLPGSPLRADLTAQLQNQMRILEVLKEQNVRMVYGDYFWVYGLNFDSDERIAGIPTVPVVDYLSYSANLGDSPVRWALLGGRDEVQRWANDVGARGVLTKDGDLWLFISGRPAPDAAQLITAFRN
jgi:hypothetical protein